MFLIADSGSTKTSWILADSTRIISGFTGIGLNPYYFTVEEIPVHIGKSIPPELDVNEVKKIFFYGSGCATFEKSEIIKKGLNMKFPDAQIEVFTDLLGSAKALFGNEPGIVGILGTGANTGFYDGRNIIKNIPGFGYIMGDEGSGANLGLKLLKLYLHNELPVTIADDFKKTFNLSDGEILDRIYRKPLPNRFLASFTKFIFSNIDNEIILKLVRESFDQFFDKYICRYDDYRKYQIKLSGSVAFRYADILHKTAKERELSIAEIIKFPIERLADYHVNRVM
jgi:glucosamine kinase